MPDEVTRAAAISPRALGILRRLRPDAAAHRQRADLEAEVTRLRRQRNRARRRLAKATVDPELGYLFVITYGRSGSTLLQGILNSIPGYLIRGENRQVLRHLYDYHTSALAQRAQLRRKQRRKSIPVGGLEPLSPFYGLDGFPRKRSLSGSRQLAVRTLLRPEADTRVVGYKEIRWAEDDVADFVDWLREVFPRARFVINTRNLDDVSQSKWWADSPGALAELTAVETRLLQLRDVLGESAFHIRYDDYVRDPTALAPLFTWLGEELDLDAVRGVLSVPHSY